MLSQEENRIQSQQLQNEDSNDGIAYNTGLLKSNPGAAFDVLGKAFANTASEYAENARKVNTNDCENCDELAHKNQMLEEAPNEAIEFITNITSELEALKQPNYDINNPSTYMVLNNIINRRPGYGESDGYNIALNLQDNGGFELKANGPKFDEEFKINSNRLKQLINNNKSLISTTPNINEGIGEILTAASLINPAFVNPETKKLNPDARISIADYGVLDAEGNPIYDQIEIEIDGKKYMRNVYQYDESKIVKKLVPILQAEVAGYLSDEQSAVAAWNMYLANDTSMVQDDERVKDKNAGDKSWAYQNLPLNDKQKKEFSEKYHSYFIKNTLLPFIQNQVPEGEDGKPTLIPQTTETTDEDLYKKYLG